MITGAEQLEFIESPGGNSSAALATPSRGSHQVSVIRQRQISGGLNPDHIHDRDEFIFLLNGSVHVTVNDESLLLNAGDSVRIPPRALHRIENAGDSVAEWLLIATAGIRFFHAGGDEASPPWSK